MRDLRICARKVQAGSLQLSSIIRETEGGRAERNSPPREMRERVEELEKENQSLKKCIEELKGQMKIVREMYTEDDFEDRRKMKKLEKEIKELKEEKEEMRKEITELRDKEMKKDVTNESKNKAKNVMNIDVERKGSMGGIFSPMAVSKSSRGTGTRGKARGPPEEYEEEGEGEIRMGKWDYVGASDPGKRDEGRRICIRRERKLRVAEMDTSGETERGEG